MSKFLVPFFIFVFFISAYPQEFNLFGPRAGIGYLNSSGKSSIEKGNHSAFGWQVEIPYKGKKVTGYGEAGLYLLAIEQGRIYPHVWAYFGGRYNNIGLGAGPVFNAIGIGLGINTYTQIDLGVIRMPIGIDMNFIEGTTRIQLFIGFNYK